jgi:hypothetical protein
MSRARRWIIYLAPFLIALVGYLGAMREMRPPFTADEPHYALEAFSIALDGDVDLANDYASIDRAYAATDDQTTTLQPHAYRWVPGGELVSMHNVGLPLLLAPAARISQSVRALELEMVLLAAIAAQLLYSILAKVVPRHRTARWASWAVVVFSLPLLGYSSRLYPELPAALIGLGVVRILVSDRLRLWQILLAGLLIAFLPWLHVRFGVIAAGLIVAVLLRMVELRPVLRSRGIAVGAVVLLVPVVVSLGVMSLQFHRWYGTYSLTAQLHTTDQIARAQATPSAPASSDASGASGASGSTATTPAKPSSSSVFDFLNVDDVVPGLMRSLWSSRNGWIPFIPVGFLALAGALALAARARWWVALGVLVALAYMVEIASTGVLPAYSLPGRYEMVFLPLLAVPLAMVLAEVRWTWFLFWPLAAVGAIVAVFGMSHTGGLVPFQAGSARADIGAANVWLRAFPTVSREQPEVAVPTYTIGVCTGSHPGGTVHGCGPTGYVAAAAGGGERVVWTSAERDLPPSDYGVAVGLSRDAGGPDVQGAAATIDILVDGQVVVHQPVTAAEIPVDAYRAFIQAVRLGDGQKSGVRVSTTGAVGLRVSPASLRSNISPLTGLAVTTTRYPDIWAVLAWTAVLIGLTAAIAFSLPPPHRRPVAATPS